MKPDFLEITDNYRRLTTYFQSHHMVLTGSLHFSTIHTDGKNEDLHRSLLTSESVSTEHKFQMGTRYGRAVPPFRGHQAHSQWPALREDTLPVEKIQLVPLPQCRMHTEKRS